MNYDNLESKAALLKIINLGEVNRKRKESIPQSVFKDKNFTFGMKSELHLNSEKKSLPASSDPNTPY
jgi:hypothetical protein